MPTTDPFINPLDQISPGELVKDALERWGAPNVAPYIVVGPANHDQQQAGVASITAAGLPLVERYSPLQWSRVQIRCLHGTLDGAETIAQAVFRDLNQRVRLKVRQASTDAWYVLHLSNVTAGPSYHYDSPETWECLVFAEVLIGTQKL